MLRFVAGFDTCCWDWYGGSFGRILVNLIMVSDCTFLTMALTYLPRDSFP